MIVYDLFKIVHPNPSKEIISFLIFSFGSFLVFLNIVRRKFQPGKSWTNEHCLLFCDRQLRPSVQGIAKSLSLYAQAESRSASTLLISIRLNCASVGAFPDPNEPRPHVYQLHSSPCAYLRPI